MSLEPSDLLEPLLSLMEDPSVREGVADTARLFFQSSTATVNLIPSFIILGGLLTALLSALGIPILSSLGINLTGSGSSNGGYGAPASSYGLSGRCCTNKHINKPLQGLAPTSFKINAL